ncbi:MAG: hypothetical protein ACD_15C00137G0030 [uncultured bacterium]|nr:MAG: hypothetical protein ACD_15C00137G0030 [uncultured bacterium]HCU70522.1 hypothetical protein [Candidatus Moranbacteria bacterium]
MVIAAGLFFSQMAMAGIGGIATMECRDGRVYESRIAKHQSKAEESWKATDKVCASFVDENSGNVVGKKIPESQFNTQSLRIVGINGVYLASTFPDGSLRADVPTSISFKLWGRKDGKIDQTQEGPLTEPAPIRDMPDTGIRLADGTFVNRVIEKEVPYLVLDTKGLE